MSADGSPVMVSAPTFRVTAKPHPFRDDLIRGDMDIGPSLRDIGAGGAVLAWIDGERIEDLDTVPHAGQNVVLRTVPQGLFDFILSPLAFLGIPSPLDLLGDLIGSLIPIPNFDVPLTPGAIPASASTSNRGVPYGVVPRVYGRMRIFPPLGGNAYTEFAGDDQWLRMLFDCGPGPLVFEPATARIGDTLLSNYENQIEYLTGDAGGAPIKLYTRNVFEAPLADAFNLDGTTVTRTTAAGTREITLDLAAAALVRISDKGNRKFARVAFKVEIKPSGGSFTTVTPTHSTYPGQIAGAGEYGVAVPGTTGSTYSLYGSDDKPYRATLRIVPATSGQFDIKITRTSAASDNGQKTEPDDQFFSEFTWTALRSFGADIAQTVPAGTAMIALRIKITEQLGRNVDNFSIVAQSKVLAWNGSAWVLAATSNPAWIFRDILLGTATARPLAPARVDDEVLKAWGADCTSKGRTFCGIFETRTTMREALKAVAATGRASLQRRNGLFGVIQDTTGLTPVMTFTDRDTWNFSGAKQHLPPIHALKGQFQSETADWLADEKPVYADGYSFDGSGGTTVATEFQTVKLFGFTTWPRVFEELRYEIAKTKLRPETASFECDLAGLIPRRGTVIEYQSDINLVGLGSARILSISGGSVTLDDEFTLVGGQTYQVKFRKDTAASVTSTISTGAGTTRTLAISGGIPSGVAVGDLVAVGETNKVTVQGLVTDIARAPQFRARISFVPYSPAVHDPGTLPPYDPSITRKPERPPAPIILRATPRYRNTIAGDRVPAIRVQYQLRASEVPIASIELGFRDVADLKFTSVPIGRLDGALVFQVPDAQSIYIVRMYAIGADGLFSSSSDVTVDFQQGVVGDLTTIILGELTDFPETRKDRFSTVVITVPPPAILTNYQTALVQHRRLGRPRWRDIGFLDEFNQAFMAFRSDGATHEFRARAVSTFGPIDDGGPTASITLTDNDGTPNEADTTLTPYVGLNVPNLRIRGQTAAVTTFTGQDLRLQWDAPPMLPLGHKILDYRVRLRVAATPFGTGALLYQSRELHKRLDYTIDQNVLDSGALGYTDPLRALDVEVICRTDRGGRSASAATKVALNPAPLIPGDLSIKGLKTSIRVGFSRPLDDDYVRTVVYASQTNNFTPLPGNQQYDGRDTKPIFIPDLAPGTWYVRVELYDRFGVGSLSPQFLAEVGGDGLVDTNPPSTPPAPTLTSSVTEANQITFASLTVSWAGSSDPEGAPISYRVRYWPGSDASLAGRVQIDHEGAAGSTQTVTIPGVVAGLVYSVSVRAADAAGNRSPFGPTSTKLIDKDNLAPAAPTGFVTLGRVSKVLLRWVNPTDADFSHVEIHRGTASNFAADATTEIYRGSSNRYADDDATFGVPYFYRIRSVDRSGNPTGFNGFSTPAISGTPSGALPNDDLTPPPVPSNVSVSGIVQQPGFSQVGRLTAVWDAVTDAVTGSKVSYEIRIFESADETFRHIATTRDTTYTLQGVRIGGTYSVKVRSIDANDNRSLFSAPVSDTVDVDTTPPGAPTGLTASGRRGRVVLKWLNPTDTDFLDVDVHRSTVNASFTPVPATLIGTLRGTRFADADADVPSTVYFFKLIARDIAGNASVSTAGVSASPSVVDVDTVAPGVPTLVAADVTSTVEVADQVSDASLRMQWAQIIDPQGALVHYEVELWPTAYPSRIRRRLVEDSGAATSNVTFEGVGAQRDYSVRLRAIDATGNKSAFSSPTITHTTGQDAAAPANVTSPQAIARVGRILLKWVNPLDADFMEVDVHRVTGALVTPDLAVGSATRVYTGSSIRTVDNEVAAGTSYYYRWYTRDRSGNRTGPNTAVGPVTPTSNDVVADISPPPTPSGLNLVSVVETVGQVNDASLTATWNESVDPQGNPVTYEVELWPTAAPTRIRRRVVPDSGVATTTVTFEGVGANRSYTGRVRALDAAGNGSAFSAAASVTSGVDITAPGTVFAFTAVAQVGRINLKWGNPSDADFALVQVWRSSTSGFVPPSAGTLIYEGRSNRYTDSDSVFQGSTYFYKCITKDVSGNASAPSPQVSGSVAADDYLDDPSAPAAPTNVFASFNNAGDLQIDWTNPTSSSLRDVEVSVYSNSGLTSLYYREYSTRQTTTFTAAQNIDAGSGAADPTLYVQLRARARSGASSATVVPVTQPVKALPIAPSSVTLTGYFSSVGVTVTGQVPPGGTLRFRVIQTNPLASDVLFESPSTAITRDLPETANYRVGVRTVDALGQASLAETLSNTITVDSLTLADLRAEAIYGDSNGSAASTLAVLKDANLGSGGIGYAVSASWNRRITFSRELTERYRTVTLSMSPDPGTSSKWYLRTSLDGITWSYYAGTGAGAVGGNTLALASPNTAAQAQTNAVSSSNLGNPNNSRVDLPAIVEARYVELYVQNGTGGTTVREFYPRRLVQSDDLEADSVRALHIAAGQIDASHISAQTLTGVTIQTATSGPRVELSTFNGVRTINSVGTVTAQQRIDGSGYVGGFVSGPNTIGTLAWDSSGNTTLNGNVTMLGGGRFRTAATGARVEFDTGGIVVRNAAGVQTFAATSDGAGFLGLAPGSIRWDTAGVLTFDAPITLKSDILFANTANLYRGKVNFGQPTAGFWLGNESQIPKMHVGSGTGTTGQFLQFDGGAGTVLAQGTFRTKGALNVRRVEMDFDADNLRFYDGSELAAALDIISSGGSDSYLTGGLVHTGSLLGSTTQQGRIGVRGYSGSNAAVYGLSVGGNGVTGKSTSAKGLEGESLNSVGVYGIVTSSGNGNGYGGDVNFATRCGGLFHAVGGSSSVALAARGNYAGVFQASSNTIGGSLLLKGNTSGGAIPTHAAESGTVSVRYPGPVGSGVATPYIQRGGDLHGAGMTWKEIATGLYARLTAPFTGLGSNTTAQTVFTLTIPANTITVGTCFEIVAFGTQSQSAASNTVAFELSVGGTALLTPGGDAGIAAQTNRAVAFSALILFNAIGSTGTVTGGSELSIDELNPFLFGNSSNFGVNTTAAVNITLAVRNYTSNAANIIRVRSAYIREV